MTRSDSIALDRAHGLRCFLVEDSALIRHNLIAMLEEMLAMQVIGSAEDEAGALGWLMHANQPCDIMIIDIFLKTGTGIPVLKQARKRWPLVKLVVLTNYDTPEMRRHCLTLGADRVFDKSRELDDLILYCSNVLPPKPTARAA